MRRECSPLATEVAPGMRERTAVQGGPEASRGVGFGALEVPSMTDRRNPEHLTGRSAWGLHRASTLPVTADQSRGSSNLATRPRAGNISTDTRAGRPG